MWINTMPHAVAKVDLSINGNAWAFEGVGYHDQVSSTDSVLLELKAQGHRRIGESTPTTSILTNGIGGTAGPKIIQSCGSTASARLALSKLLLMSHKTTILSTPGAAMVSRCGLRLRRVSSIPCHSVSTGR